MIDVCLFFYEAVIFSATFFRFLFVKLNLWAIGMKIGEARQTARCASLKRAGYMPPHHQHS
jgi:hypothetical protein